MAASLAVFELAGCSSAPGVEASSGSPSRPGRHVRRAAARGHRGVPAGADRNGVHLRRPHPPRDPGRPLGPGRPRDDVTRALDAAAGLQRHATARLRRQGELPARPLPGQRHDGGRADRRPELGPGQRADPVPRRPRHPGRSRQGSPAVVPAGSWWRTSSPPTSGRWRPPSTRCRAPWQSGPPAAFKVYTAWSPSGQGYSLEDPDIGLPTVQHAHDLGVKVFVAHKGLPLVNFDPQFNHPDDIVAVSRLFPDMQLSGVPRRLGSLPRRGSLRPDRHHRHRHACWPRSTGTTSRRTTTCGSTWRPCGASCSPNPTRPRTRWASCSAGSGAQRVLWGTDAIWYGSPEPQIMAMEAFEITPEFQEILPVPGPDGRA